MTEVVVSVECLCARAISLVLILIVDFAMRQLGREVGLSFYFILGVNSLSIFVKQIY